MARLEQTIPPDGELHGWPLWLALGVVVLAWLVLGWPWLSGRVTIPWDAKAHFQPQIQFLADSLWRGEGPWWTPFVFSGHNQAADPQSMIFSPPLWLLALTGPSPGLHAVDVTVLATILAGALAIVVWFRDRGWHWAGAVLAAIAFAFGASMAWRIQHTGQVLSLAYLPIVVLLLERALDRNSVWHGIAAGVAAAFLVLGRDQVALLVVYLLVGLVVTHWAGWHDGADRPVGTRIRQSIPPLVAGGIVGALLIALPVLMTALTAEQSNRPAIDYIGAARGSLHPALLVTLFAPDVFGSSGRMEDYWGPPSFTWNDTGLFIAQNMGQLYIGAVPVLLLLLGLFSGALWRREIRFFTIALAVMLIYALGWYTPAFRWIHAALPGVDFYRRPADATFLIGYLTATLAGYSAHRMFCEPDWTPPRHAVVATAITAVAAFAVVAYLAVHFDRVSMAAMPFAIAAGIVISAAVAIALARHIEPLRPLAAALLLAAHTVADLAWSNGPGGATALPPQHYAVLEPGAAPQTITRLREEVSRHASPVRRDRVELIGLGFHWPNASLTHRLENTLGYNPVRTALYSAATGAGNTAGSPGDRQFSPLFPSYRSILADLLGLRYIASGVPIEEIDKTLAPGTLPLVARTPEGFIYENPRALPRVLFATRTARADFAAIVEGGRWPIGEDTGAEAFRDTVLIEDDVTAPQPGTRGTARIEAYANNRVDITADSTGGGFVVLNDMFHPWWQATVDGLPARVLRANVLFRAVAVPPGRHGVTFSFTPFRGALSEAYGRLSASRTPDRSR